MLLLLLLLLRCTRRFMQEPPCPRAATAHKPICNTERCTDALLVCTSSIGCHLFRLLKTAAPGARLGLSVRVQHPQLADFFSATLSAEKSDAVMLPNEYAGFRTLLR